MTYKGLDDNGNVVTEQIPGVYSSAENENGQNIDIIINKDKNPIWSLPTEQWTVNLPTIAFISSGGIETGKIFPC